MKEKVFIQRCTYDEEEQRSSRIGMISDLDVDIYDVIDEIIQEMNPYAK